MTSNTPTIELTIYGHPHPQGSKSAMRNKHTGRIHMIEGSRKGAAKHKAWRQAVADAARGHLDRGGHIAAGGPLEVHATFVIPKPKSKPKRDRWVTVKPDVDKLARSLLDGLADGGLLVGGDQRVAALHVAKRYARVEEPTGATVTVGEMDHRAADVLETLGGPWQRLEV